MMRLTGNIFKTFAVILISSVFIGSCQKDAGVHYGDCPVVLKASVGEQTRSGIIDSDSSSRPLADVDGIQIIRGADGDVPAFNQVQSVSILGHIDAGSDILVASPSQHFPLDANGVPLDEDINFLAYYPQGDSYVPGTGDSPAKVFWNLSDGLTDIIYSEPAEGNYYENSGVGIDLHFVHALSRLRLVVVADDYDSQVTFKSVVSAKIDVPDQVTMLVDKDGNATFEYGPADESQWQTIDFCKDGQKLEVGYPAAGERSLDILIPPIEGRYSFRFAFEGLGSVDKKYSVDNLPLLPGKTTVLTITVKGGVLMLLAPYVEMFEDVPVGGPIVIE